MTDQMSNARKDWLAHLMSLQAVDLVACAASQDAHPNGRLGPLTRIALRRRGLYRTVRP